MSDLLNPINWFCNNFQSNKFARKLAREEERTENVFLLKWSLQEHLGPNLCKLGRQKGAKIGAKTNPNGAKMD